MKTLRVGTARVHIWNKGKERPPADAVYVGRPTKFGNPYAMGCEKDRGYVIRQYRQYLDLNPSLQEAARRELRGRDLVCFCSPLPCHADILAEYANATEEDEGMK